MEKAYQDITKKPRLTDGTYRTSKLISSSWSKIGLKRKRPENEF